MVLDYEKIKTFWKVRAKKQDLDESLTNFEKDKKELKKRIEEEKINKYVIMGKDKTLLDMGCGWGRWSFYFANNFKRVIGVDFCDELIDAAFKIKKEKNIEKVTFYISPVQLFKTYEKFDVVLFSGIIQYLNDYDVKKMLKNIEKMTKENTQIILREPTGIKGRYELNNKYSKELKTNYSSIYRTKDDFEKLFGDISFKLFRFDNMYPDGCLLNKWKETRLMIYDFRGKKV